MNIIKFKINNIMLIVFMTSIVIYFNGVIRMPALSPAIIIPMIFFFIYIYSSLFKKKINHIFFVFLFMAIFSLMILNYQFDNLVLISNYYNEIGRICVPFITTIGFLYFYNKEKKLFEHNVKLILTIVAYIFFIFGILRVVLAGGAGLYSFKDSFMFADGNFDGLIILYIYMIAMSAGYIDRKLRLIFIFACILSFSRNIWIGLFIFEAYRFYIRNKMISSIFLFLILCLLIHPLYTMYNDIVTDGSFLTKLEIFNFFIQWVNNSKIDNLILGLGSNNLMMFFERGSHNLFGLTIELGFMFMSVYLLFLITFTCRFINKRYRFIVLFVVILTGFVSLYPITYMSVFYIYTLFFYKIRGSFV